jgi:hypothetical protein
MIAAGATMVAFALPATAQGFSGPWDRAHQPSTITNQSVIFHTASPVDDGSLAVMINPPKRCQWSPGVPGIGTLRAR